MLQCVAVCCSVSQCVQCVVTTFVATDSADVVTTLQVCVALCCSALLCVAVCCNVLQCVALCCSVLQCVAVCCSVLQCVAVCCSVLQCVVFRGCIYCGADCTHTYRYI